MADENGDRPEDRDDDTPTPDEARYQPENDDDDGKGGHSTFWLFLIAGVVILLLGGGIYWWLSTSGETSSTEPPPPPLVQAGQAEPAARVSIRQTAFIQPLAEVAVTAQVQARVAEVADGFRRGARVERGELLVRLETDRLEAAVDRAEASVQQAEAALAAARVERDRQAELEEDDFTSEAELQQAIVEVATQQANLSTARANLSTARADLSDAELRAPFDAVVVAADADIGAFASPGQELGRLVASAAVEAELGLTPADLALLGGAEMAVGGRVLVRGTGQAAVAERGRSLGPVAAYGVVDTIGAEVQDGTRTIPLIVRIPRPFDPERSEGRPLRIGELVELDLPISLVNRRAVSILAVALKSGDMVWEVRDGVLVRHEVTVLSRRDEIAVIEADGLAPGTVLMTSDLPAAADGVEVRLPDESGDGGSGSGNGDGGPNDDGGDTAAASEG